MIAKILSRFTKVNINLMTITCAAMREGRYFAEAKIVYKEEWRGQGDFGAMISK